MSKHARVEAIRKLKEQLKLATDPETIVKITNSIAKLTPRPRQARRPRSTQTPIKVKKGASALVAKWADRLSHVQPEGKRIFTAVILEGEERGRNRGISFHPPSAESRALLEEVMGVLSVEERAVLNSGSTEVG